MQQNQESDQDRSAAGLLTQDMMAGCVGVRVGRLHRLVSREFERHLRPVGLSLQQLEVLSTLTACGEPVKPTVVADLLAVERSTMSRNLAILIDRGWAISTDTSATGRSLAVEITAAGTAKLAEAGDAWRHAQAALISHLGSDAPATLNAWLAALA
ncbi:DNA-binding MarR family transcriptional regulator [Nakamurella sp. UYEF19]|uniref:MarR family winged helix-turn-helix transcriptional regulator n=1 Tax=Nakamurella sp. UYEF19 TaxID=1756392 RepID=UPI00339AB376